MAHAGSIPVAKPIIDVCSADLSTTSRGIVPLISAPFPTTIKIRTQAFWINRRSLHSVPASTWTPTIRIPSASATTQFISSSPTRIPGPTIPRFTETTRRFTESSSHRAVHRFQLHLRTAFLPAKTYPAYMAMPLPSLSAAYPSWTARSSALHVHHPIPGVVTSAPALVTMALYVVGKRSTPYKRRS